MPTKVLIERWINPGSLARFLELSMKLRAEAVRQPGYISGETLVSTEHDNLYLVISTWRSLDDWKAWLRNPERIKLTAEMEPLMAQPAETKTYTDMWGSGAP